MKKKAEDQMIFTFESARSAEKEEVSDDGLLHPLDIKRAVLGWLISKNPDGISLGVPTRISKFCADVAAFWSETGKKRILVPTRTLIVETRLNREDCWPDCSKQAELLEQLRKKKENKRLLEAGIRENEPELKDTDNLFDEYESWRYRESKNKDYMKCLKDIENMEQAIYNGTFFEQIRRALVADYLYLAVPEGVVHADELADSWGLIYVKPDLSTTLIKEAESWDCPVEKRMHLVQNIASSCKKSLLFSYGVREDSKGRPLFTPLPHRRRGKPAP